MHTQRKCCKTVRLKNKNGLKLSNGKSLIELVTRNVEDSRLIDGIIFTSDSEDYKNTLDNNTKNN